MDRHEMIQASRKLIIVGDPMCGKRTLLLSFVTNQFVTDDYTQHILDTPVIPIQVNRRTIHMALFDITAAEDHDRLRSLFYPRTNIVLICFSIDNPTSVMNVMKKWTPEIRLHCHQCPIILVACKTDLRKDSKRLAELEKQGETLVTSEMGRRLAVKIKADAYMECSAKTREGVQDLFIRAARLSVKKHSHHTVKCQCILQ
ncbi:unnamed protein product [Rotaria sordida]|uniref:Uncharacterized protein n=1 Tax=Rotaria sordida TaxID=392033 RepID=A0A813UM68_9BILA|nr:unnamed protein product [Rotaria sordida]CAF1039778.1 unnamed protein product [Rotaria sordida]CAF1040194.1 unnamed protein product [Rotaria sordida]CAF1098729.1 unnamed protein product [Rotaria sordida]CAF1200134.1 unnamed protein product [Rotaria sordida]